MIHNWNQLLMLGIGTFFMIVWIFLALKYRTVFDNITDHINAKDYIFPTLYFIGFGMLDLIHYDLKKKANSKKMNELAEVNGKKYAQYYYYLNIGGKITYALTLIPIGFLIGALSNQLLFAGIGIGVAGLLIIDLDAEFQSKVEKRRNELLMELPQVVSKMALLVRAGMPLRSAWRQIAETGEGLLYQEMQVTVQEMQRGGILEEDAYRNFANRCEIKEIKKLSSMITQNLKKGNAELAYYLKEMSNETWEMKKNLVKQKGEIAKSKLVIPTVLIFIGILIMIVVPIFSSL